MPKNGERLYMESSCGRAENRLDSNKYINLKDFPIKIWWETNVRLQRDWSIFYIFAFKKRIKIKMHFCQTIKESIINRNQYTQAEAFSFLVLLFSIDFSFTMERKEEVKHLLTSMSIQQKQGGRRGEVSREKLHTKIS